jgi:hypothetical protein
LTFPGNISLLPVWPPWRFEAIVFSCYCVFVIFLGGLVFIWWPELHGRKGPYANNVRAMRSRIALFVFYSSFIHSQALQSRMNLGLPSNPLPFLPISSPRSPSSHSHRPQVLFHVIYPTLPWTFLSSLYCASSSSVSSLASIFLPFARCVQANWASET